MPSICGTRTDKSVPTELVGSTRARVCGSGLVLTGRMQEYPAPAAHERINPFPQSWWAARSLVFGGRDFPTGRMQEYPAPVAHERINLFPQSWWAARSLVFVGRGFPDRQDAKVPSACGARTDKSVPTELVGSTLARFCGSGFILTGRVQKCLAPAAHERINPFPQSCWAACSLVFVGRDLS